MATYVLAVRGAESSWILPLCFVSTEERARKYIENAVNFNKENNEPRDGTWELYESPSHYAEDLTTMTQEMWDEVVASSKKIAEGEFVGNVMQQASRCCSRSALVRGY